MTRKDFQRIASVIAACLDAQRAYPQAKEGIVGLALNLAEMLAISNPRFNRAMFLKACNVPDSQENSDEAENS